MRMTGMKMNTSGNIIGNTGVNACGIALLSGGLDSYVSLDSAVKKMKVKLALTFNYGQIAYEDEKTASGEIAKHYKIKHKIINLPFLKEITDPNEIWVPNRNGLFLNIAASFADKFCYDYIIFGANKEEGLEFSDNSIEFLKKADKFFEFSTRQKPKIYAPLKDLSKIEIVNLGIKNGINFELLKSCYNSEKITGKKHCGKCKSCLFLKNALEGALENCNNKSLIKQLF